MRHLGLPARISACLFDLDGVLTHTAAIHFEAWKRTFDDYLSRRAASNPRGMEGFKGSETFQPFEMPDYLRYVDGKPRAEGVSSFLVSRGIELPLGSPNDSPAAETILGMGNRKNELVLKLMEQKGVEAFEGSKAYLRAVRDAGLKTAVVSASTNTDAVLAASGLAQHFDTVVDGNVAKREGLPGKPYPDTFLHAARAVGVPPEDAAVFEDALAGVKAGRDGRFGFVVGVDRAGQAEALKREGADVVVTDLAELLEEA